MAFLINREKMHFLYKHTSKHVLSSLAWIQNSDIATIILDGDLDQWSYFTLYELNRLYINTTGEKLAGIPTNDVYKAIYNLSQQIPEIKVNGFEVIAQADCIRADEDEFEYMYNPGSTKPRKVSELFERPIKLVRAKNTNLAVEIKGAPIAEIRTTASAKAMPVPLALPAIKPPVTQQKVVTQWNKKQ